MQRIPGFLFVSFLCLRGEFGRFRSEGVGRRHLGNVSSAASFQDHVVGAVWALSLAARQGATGQLERLGVRGSAAGFP